MKYVYRIYDTRAKAFVTNCSGRSVWERLSDVRLLDKCHRRQGVCTSHWVICQYKLNDGHSGGEQP